MMGGMKSVAKGQFGINKAAETAELMIEFGVPTTMHSHKQTGDTWSYRQGRNWKGRH